METDEPRRALDPDVPAEMADDPRKALGDWRVVGPGDDPAAPAGGPDLPQPIFEEADEPRKLP
jgi:hypothetical protein